MGQGESKGSSPSYARKESRRTIAVSNGSTGSSGGGSSPPAVVAKANNFRKSVQLTDKEKKKLQQLQQKAEAKKLKQFEKEELQDDKTEKKKGRERAATKIQAAMRGTMGRRKFVKFKEEREKKAATKIQAIVRGWLGRKSYKKLRGRTIVARELHITERDYLGFLSAIIKYYIKPLRLMDENDHPLMTNDEMKVIFNQVEVIHAYNMQFLVALEYNIGKKWSFVQTVGDIFLTYVEFFRAPYKQFIMKYSEASAMLELCGKRSGVDAFFQKCKKQLECGNRDLRSLLSMPFQRIPRYILLLRELLKYTRREHDDFTYICKALEKMEDLASSANEQIRHFELTNAVLDISKSFEPPIQNLVNPYRKFRRDGELQCKKEHSQEKFYDATVFLFNDCVIAAVRMTTKGVTKFRPKLVVNLKNCVVLDCTDSDGLEEGKKLTDSWDMSIDGGIRLTDSSERQQSHQMYEFRIHSLTESVIFRANSQEAKDLWMSHIITEVNLLTESKLTSHPLWRSKASYGISSLRKKTLQRNRTLSQAKFERKESITTRKDSNARKEDIPRRKESTSEKDKKSSRKESVSEKDKKGTQRKESISEKESFALRKNSIPEPATAPTANIEAQNHAKHIAELTNLIASKQRTKSMSSGVRPDIQMPPDTQPEVAKELPKESPRAKAQSMIALPGLGQKVRPPVPPREKSTISKSLIYVGQTPYPTVSSDYPKSPDEPTKSSTPDESPSKPSESLELPPTALEPTGEPIAEPVLSEETEEPLTEPTTEQLMGQFTMLNPEGYSPENSTSSLLSIDSNSMKDSTSLASSLGLQLAEDVEAGLTKFSSELTPEALGVEEGADQGEADAPPLSLSSSSAFFPSTPKPTTRPVDDLRSSRPALPSSTASNSFSPILLSPLSPPQEGETVLPRRKHSHAPPLTLENSQPRTTTPPPRTMTPPPRSTSPSSVSSPPRYSSFFDSPRTRPITPADRSSPMLGNVGKRFTILNTRQPSDENISPASPIRSPSQAVFSSAFISQVRSGRIARMSKYEKFDGGSSTGGMRRSASASSNSDSEGSDSQVWRQSMSSSNASQGMQLSLPTLPMPRSVSTDAILCIPHHPHHPSSHQRDDANNHRDAEANDHRDAETAYYHDIETEYPQDTEAIYHREVEAMYRRDTEEIYRRDAEANGNIGYFDTRTGEIWDSDLVDNEVIEILSSRFRSLSFSCVEDLLEYGFEVDAQI